MIADHIYGNQLLDFYGSLLTAHQREILSDYYANDYSMQEIAENHSISKAAVSDLINRCSRQLEGYEKKLKLIERHEKRMSVLQEMTEAGLSAHAKRLQQIEEE